MGDYYGFPAYVFADDVHKCRLCDLNDVDDADELCSECRDEREHGRQLRADFEAGRGLRR